MLLEYLTSNLKLIQHENTNYLHMSWGDNPEVPDQAWYYQDNLPSTGNYTSARKIITAKPNN